MRNVSRRVRFSPVADAFVSPRAYWVAGHVCAGPRVLPKLIAPTSSNESFIRGMPKDTLENNPSSLVGRLLAWLVFANAVWTC